MSLMQGMDETKVIKNMQELCEGALEIFGNNQDAAFEWLCSQTARRWAVVDTPARPMPLPAMVRW